MTYQLPNIIPFAAFKQLYAIVKGTPSNNSYTLLRILETMSACALRNSIYVARSYACGLRWERPGIYASGEYMGTCAMETRSALAMDV